MKVRRNTGRFAITAVLTILLGFLVSVVAENPAMALSGCKIAFHYTGKDPYVTYNLYKYECSGGYTYGYMTGRPDWTACIVISLGNVTDGPCDYIAPGYTPPKSSVTTRVISAGADVKLWNICFRDYHGYVLWCHNDYG